MRVGYLDGRYGSKTRASFLQSWFIGTGAHVTEILAEDREGRVNLDWRFMACLFPFFFSLEARLGYTSSPRSFSTVHDSHEFKTHDIMPHTAFSSIRHFGRRFILRVIHNIPIIPFQFPRLYLPKRPSTMYLQEPHHRIHSTSNSPRPPLILDQNTDTSILT